MNSAASRTNGPEAISCYSRRPRSSWPLSMVHLRSSWIKAKPTSSQLDETKACLPMIGCLLAAAAAPEIGRHLAMWPPRAATALSCDHPSNGASIRPLPSPITVTITVFGTQSQHRNRNCDRKHPRSSGWARG